MDYIRRHLETVVQESAGMFAAVIVTGARQTGKTSLLMEIKGAIPYISLDEPRYLEEAVEEAGTFFIKYPPPVVLDEIQYAPGLFTYIKLIADGVYGDGVRPRGERRKGLFFMSGSQQYALMKNVSESLAGRIGILELFGLSRRELEEVPFDRPFLPLREYLEERAPFVRPFPYKDVWEAIWRGSLPEMQDPTMDWERFYSSYIRSYLDRDIHQLANVGNELGFYKFMTVLAANTGQLLNLASIAAEVRVSIPTVEHWLSILRASGIVYLLRPYHNNILKRVLKTPKIYFCDTGLVCFLSRWDSPGALERGAAAGHIFENYVVMEIIKSYANAGREPGIYFYRDKQQNEIDLIFHENGTLYPLEIKKTADPRRDDIKSFRYLENIPGVIRGPGGVICLANEPYPLGEKDTAIPLGYI